MTRRSGEFVHGPGGQPRNFHKLSGHLSRKSQDLTIKPPTSASASATPSPSALAHCGSLSPQGSADLSTSPKPGSCGLIRKSLDKPRRHYHHTPTTPGSLPRWPGDKVADDDGMTADLAGVLPLLIDALPLETRKVLRLTSGELCGYVGSFFTRVRRYPHAHSAPANMGKRFPGLRSLDLQGCDDLSDEQLASAVGGLSQLTELDISECTHASTATLAALAALPALVKLKLHAPAELGKARDDATMAAFCRMKRALHAAVALPRLRELDLSAHFIDDVLLDQLGSSATGLTRLKLNVHSITDSGVAAVSRLPRLRSLELSAFKPTAVPSSLEGLSRLAATLEALSITNVCLAAPAFAQLGGLTALTSLSIGPPHLKMPIKDESAAQLAALTRLSHLALPNLQLTDCTLVALAATLGGRLATLSLATPWCNFSKGGMEALAGMTGLRRLAGGTLDLESLVCHSELASLPLPAVTVSTDFENVCVEALKRFRCVRQLTLDALPATFDDTGLQELAAVAAAGLESITIKDCNWLHGMGLALWKGAERLTRVVLSGNRQLSGSSLHAVARFPCLASLELLDCDGLDDAAVSLLTEGGGGLANTLTSLKAARLPITDGACPTLGQLTALKQLTLVSVGVTCQGLKALSSLQALTELHLLRMDLCDAKAVRKCTCCWGFKALSSAASLTHVTLWRCNFCRPPVLRTLQHLPALASVGLDAGPRDPDAPALAKLGVRVDGHSWSRECPLF